MPNNWPHKENNSKIRLELCQDFKDFPLLLARALFFTVLNFYWFIGNHVTRIISFHKALFLLCAKDIKKKGLFFRQAQAVKFILRWPLDLRNSKILQN